MLTHIYEIPSSYSRYFNGMEAALRDDSPKSAFVPYSGTGGSPVMNAHMKNKVQARRGKNREAKKAKRTNR